MGFLTSTYGFFAIFGALAALTCAFIVVKYWWGPSARRRDGQWYLEALMVILGPLICTVVAFYPADGTFGGPFPLVNRVLSLIAVALSAYALLRGLRRPRRGVVAILYATIAYYLVLIISGFAGPRPELPEVYLTTPLIILAFIVNGSYSYSWLVTFSRTILRVLIVLSLASAILIPDMSFSLVQDRTVFGIPRLEGILWHPNTMGFVSVIAILLELGSRSRVIWQLLAISTLILAQSTTGYIALLIGLTLLNTRFTRFFRKLTLSLAIAVGALAVLSPTFLPRLLAQVAPEEAGTLTGRTRIWEAAMEGFHASPLWGYGPTLLDVDYRAQYMPQGFEAAGQAHNQFIQSLAGTGIIGLSLLLVLIILLVRRAIQFRSTTAGLPLAVLGALLIRFITETPLRPTGPTITTMIIIIAICLVTTSNLREPTSSRCTILQHAGDPIPPLSTRSGRSSP